MMVRETLLFLLSYFAVCTIILAMSLVTGIDLITLTSVTALGLAIIGLISE